MCFTIGKKSQLQLNILTYVDNSKLAERQGRKAMGLREGYSYDCQVAETFELYPNFTLTRLFVWFGYNLFLLVSFQAPVYYSIGACSFPSDT